MITAVPHYLRHLPLIWLDAVLILWFQMVPGQWHMSSWNVDLVVSRSSSLEPCTNSHIFALSNWVPTLRKTWGKTTHTETCTPPKQLLKHFSITCGWNMTWPIVDSSSQPHLHLTNMEGLNLLIMWWSWLHAQEDLLTAPFRHAVMLVEGTNVVGG